MRMNLQKRSVLLIAFILFLALSINTAVLTYIAYNRYKQVVFSKVVSVGEAVIKDIEKVLDLGLSIDDIQGMNERLKSMVDDKTLNYAMILDKEGKIIFHSKEDKAGMVYRDSATLEALSTSSTFIQKWGNFYDISFPIVDAEDRSVALLRLGIHSSIVKSELYNLIVWALGIFTGFFAVFSAVIYLCVSRFITNPIIEIEKVASKVSSGDLTRTVKVLGKDEIASLSEAVNNMALHLKEIILKIKNLAQNVSIVTNAITESPASVLKVVDLQKQAIEDNVNHMTDLNTSISSIALSSESLHESVDEATAALDEMISSISHIAENANLFHTTSQEAAASIEELIASIKETANSIEVLSVSSEESSASLLEIKATVEEIRNAADESVRLAERVSSEASEKGSTSINMAVKGMEDIKQSVNEISVAIDRLEKRSEEIGSILNVIDELTSQTSLLSLNAAILAAQAGEHGKSFAVVADEIKKLAERTSVSTKDIAEIIVNVQEETKLSVKLASHGITAVDRGVYLVKDVNNALQSILESSKASTEMSKSIQKATIEEVKVISQVTESIRQISEHIERISSATKEQSLGTNLVAELAEKVKNGSERIKSATQEQHKSNKQMTSISENVSKQAEQISSAINAQKQKSEEIVRNMEKIKATTGDLILSAEEMDRSIKSLSRDAETLLSEMKKFKV